VEVRGIHCTSIVAPLPAPLLSVLPLLLGFMLAHASIHECPLHDQAGLLALQAQAVWERG